MEKNCRQKNGGKKNSQKLKKKWWPKKVLGTYLLVATELLFGLGVYRPKKGEGGDIAFEVTSYQLPVTCYCYCYC